MRLSHIRALHAAFTSLCFAFDTAPVDVRWKLYVELRAFGAALHEHYPEGAPLTRSAIQKLRRANRKASREQ